MKGRVKKGKVDIHGHTPVAPTLMILSILALAFIPGLPPGVFF
jgi:hypothetical protein